MLIYTLPSLISRRERRPRDVRESNFITIRENGLTEKDRCRGGSENKEKKNPACKEMELVEQKS